MRRRIILWIAVLLVGVCLGAVARAADPPAYNEPNFWELMKQKKISIDFKNADLDDSLRLLAQQNNINYYLVHKARGKKINFFFKDVPLEEVLNAILINSGFNYEVSPAKNIIEIKALDAAKLDTRIFTVKNIDPLIMKNTLVNVIGSQGMISVGRENKILVITDTYQKFNDIIDVIDALDIKSVTSGERSASGSGGATTRVFNLQFASAAKVKEAVSKSISDNGSIEVDEGLNALIIKDQPGALDNIGNLILNLDRETPQVIISAEVIEVNSGVLSEIGAQWIYKPGSNGQLATLNTQYNTPPVETGTENLGFVTQPLGASLVYGEVTDKLRGMINALVTTSKAEVLSSPMITVVNNEKAKIEITEKFPYNQFSGYDAQGNPQYATEFIDVGIIMSVTPHIKEGNIVNLELEPEVSFQTGERVGIPIRATRKATTKVNVRDGKTIVIGGLTSNKKTRTVYKIPILGSIPIIGQLFRRNSDSIDKVDLMIFVTPRIVTSGKIEEFSAQNREKLAADKK
ncbi:MAG: secretin N-terminal domain-containing protein [bacterium]|nr:secretin N-terminal domain-containing protein [bacterium]MDD5756437.1 secretin N-terminal domain-containing protein [bacterium]